MVPMLPVIFYETSGESQPILWPQLLGNGVTGYVLLNDSRRLTSMLYLQFPFSFTLFVVVVVVSHVSLVLRREVKAKKYV